MPESTPTGLLTGKRAVVIGGGSGIGQETAKLFAREGAAVIVGDLDAGRAERTVRAIAEAGYDSSAVVVDVTDKPGVEAAIATCRERLGGLDIVVVTPWVSTAFDLLSLTPEDWHREMNVLATGTLFVFQAAIPVMQAQGGGVLLATSSSHFGDYGPMTHPAIIPAYGSGKAAVELLVRTTARLHGREGIRVNAVQPGLTITEGVLERFLPPGMDINALVGSFEPGAMPMGPGKPEDVAEGFLFLASDHASYVTGCSLPVDGGSLTAAFGKLLA